jgi:plasmid stabilization system protein ParE
MIKPIVLTQTALNNYNAIVKYLIEEWDVSVANDFIERFVEVRNMLATNAEIFAY